MEDTNPIAIPAEKMGIIEDDKRLTNEVQSSFCIPGTNLYCFYSIIFRKQNPVNSWKKQKNQQKSKTIPFVRVIPNKSSSIRNGNHKLRTKTKNTSKFRISFFSCST